MARKMRVVGLMSGTSLDGCDAVLVEISSSNSDRLKIETKEFITHPMDDRLRKMITTQLNPITSSINQLTKLDSMLSYWFIEAVDSLLKVAGLTRSEIDLVGSHGQTMWHDVNGEDKMTWQLGDGSFISAVTGITTVCDFRTADVAIGGQGAPLIPFFDQLMYGGGTDNIALQNIGGIGNVTLVPSQVIQSHLLLTTNNCGVKGFDTGPGNMIIDRFVEKFTEGRELYDCDGRLAASGVVCDKLLQRWLLHPFFSLPPPKSTGREQFGHDYADELYKEAVSEGLRAEDAIATVTALTAKSIGLAYHIAFDSHDSDGNNTEHSLFPHKVIVAGGGARNATLMRMLQSELSPAIVVRAGEESDVSGSTESNYNFIASDSKEAVAFAVFAYQAVCGRSNHLPSTTGASREVILGKICPGDNYEGVQLKTRLSHSSKQSVTVQKEAVLVNDPLSPISVTESRHEASTAIDELTAEGVIALMNTEDVHVAHVVSTLRPVIATVAEQIASCITAGGHVYYVGAGSSGRIGVLDASEIPPTFSAPSDWFQGIIAGGDTALRNAVEGAEDNRLEGGRVILEKGLTCKDIVIGIAASGNTPFVHGALQAAKENAKCYTVLLTCNPYNTEDSSRYIDTIIAAIVGPELITGSTRLKAGTATKLILNQLSTTAMVLMGKTYGNLMVDVRVSNVKLKRRAVGIIQTIATAHQLSITSTQAEMLLEQTGGQVKLAVIVHLTGLSVQEAEVLLKECHGRLAVVIARSSGHKGYQE